VIEIAKERVFPLSAVPRLKNLPRRRQKRRLHVATCYRWAQVGVRGVRLETIRVGGTLCTSIAALQRFFDALSDAEGKVACVPSGARQRDLQRTERQLEDEGI
jgi:hypothetical protein